MTEVFYRAAAVSSVLMAFGALFTVVAIGFAAVVSDVPPEHGMHPSHRLRLSCDTTRPTKHGPVVNCEIVHR